MEEYDPPVPVDDMGPVAPELVMPRCRRGGRRGRGDDKQHQGDQQGTHGPAE